jgi:Lon protease-like protein
MPTINLPIFPLSIFLLPDGVTRLRIFEARYLKMVSMAMKNNGFVVLPIANEEQVEDKLTGSWVEIINFDQSDDGLLLIDVRCKELVEVKDMSQDKDNLHHANVSPKSHWPEVSVDESTNKFSRSLNKLFIENTELSALYKDKHLEQASWVVARWLELLPVNIDEKRLFVESGSFDAAKEFLQGIILAE